MFHFNYYAPTQVVFGKDTEEKDRELVKAQNCKKVLIHYGSGSVKRTGLLDRVKQALEKKTLHIQNWAEWFRIQDFRL